MLERLVRVVRLGPASSWQALVGHRQTSTARASAMQQPAHPVLELTAAPPTVDDPPPYKPGSNSSNDDNDDDDDLLSCCFGVFHSAL